MELNIFKSGQESRIRELTFGDLREGDIFTYDIYMDNISLYMKTPLMADNWDEYNALYLNSTTFSSFSDNTPVYKYDAPIDIDINNFIDTIAKEG